MLFCVEWVLTSKDFIQQIAFWCTWAGAAFSVLITKSLWKQAHSPLVPLTVTALWAILLCLVRAAALENTSPIGNPQWVWKCLSSHWQNCPFWFVCVLRNLGGKRKARAYLSTPGCTPVLGTGSFLHPWPSCGFWPFLLCRGQSTAHFLYLVVLPTLSCQRSQGIFYWGNKKDKYEKIFFR